MKKVFGLCLMSVIVLLGSVLLLSCENKNKHDHEGGCKVLPPVPPENPYYLDAGMQTERVPVKNLIDIRPEVPEEETEGGVESSTGYTWAVIENDWIRIRYGKEVPEGMIEITVEENTTGEDRVYRLSLIGSPGPGLGETVLQIIQRGK